MMPAGGASDPVLVSNAAAMATLSLVVSWHGAARMSPASNAPRSV